MLIVCFVCTENIGRSLIAEYCLKAYLQENGINDITAISAGTTGVDSDVAGHCRAHFDELAQLGADISKHERTQLTQELIDRCDVIVAMAENHQSWIGGTFGLEVPLFSEIADGSKNSIHVPPPESPDCAAALRQMVKDIYSSMPTFIENIHKAGKTRKR